MKLAVVELHTDDEGCVWVGWRDDAYRTMWESQRIPCWLELGPRPTGLTSTL